jgi:plasmid stabilization system protein ParE
MALSFRRSARKLYDAARSLKTSPLRGRVGRQEGTRELVPLPLPYIIADRVKDAAVEILHIHHSARDTS